MEKHALSFILSNQGLPKHMGSDGMVTSFLRNFRLSWFSPTDSHFTQSRQTESHAFNYQVLLLSHYLDQPSLKLTRLL
jgi:hypothetical protein